MISVIIPVKEAWKEVGDLISKLGTQTCRAEIIVVGSSGSPEAVRVAGTYGAKLVKVESGDFDHGGTRTMAAEEAKGDILVFLTEDVLPFDDRSIENLIRPLDDESVGASYGRQVPHPDASPFAQHLRLFNYPETSCLRGIEDRKKIGIKTPFLSNSFAAYRRKALFEIGGFKRRLILAEDIYAGAKLLLAGYKIAYAAEAVVYHSHNYTVLQEFKRYFDIGVFHESEGWILKEFGRAEGEGMKYLKSGISFLIEGGRRRLLPEFMIRNCMKYAGYFLGRNFESLPTAVTKRLSMHRQWWG